MTQVPSTLSGMTASPPPGNAPVIEDPHMPGVACPGTDDGLAVSPADAFRRFAASDNVAWYLAICRRCGEDLGQPFRSEDERDDWATQHLTATGHVVHLSVDGFQDLPGLHLSAVISRDQSGGYRFVCPAEECSTSNGPYDSAQLAIVSWRAHPPKRTGGTK